MQLQADLLAPDLLGCLLGLGKPTGRKKLSFFSGFPASFLFGAGLQVVVLNYALSWRNLATAEVSFLTSA